MERLELTERSRFVNMLTLARVPLIAAWMLFALAEERYGGFALGFFACAAMLLSGLTDLWDGWLARRWGVVSTFGKLADPLMDKIFYVVAFPTLLWLVTIRDGASFHSLLLLVFTILYILRDLWVTFMRAVGSVYGDDPGQGAHRAFVPGGGVDIPPRASLAVCVRRGGDGVAFQRVFRGGLHDAPQRVQLLLLYEGLHAVCQKGT